MKKERDTEVNFTRQPLCCTRSYNVNETGWAGGRTVLWDSHFTAVWYNESSHNFCPVCKEEFLPLQCFTNLSSLVLSTPAFRSHICFAVLWEFKRDKMGNSLRAEISLGSNAFPALSYCIYFGIFICIYFHTWTLIHPQQHNMKANSLYVKLIMSPALHSEKEVREKHDLSRIIMHERYKKEKIVHKDIWNVDS